MTAEIAMATDKRFPMPMPCGWFAIGYSDELAPGKVRNIHYFERDMVLYRTAKGAVGLVHPACPHLGAHLGHGGEVVGESLRCPFHHWQYDTQGVITDIPYAKQIPAKWQDQPCLQTYPVCEENQFLWAWYHPEGAPPDHRVLPLPEVNELKFTSPTAFRSSSPVRPNMK